MHPSQDGGELNVCFPSKLPAHMLLLALKGRVFLDREFHVELCTVLHIVGL